MEKCQFGTMLVMKPDKKKDALTDLVDVASTPANDSSNQTLSDGQAVTSSGDVVTLGIDAELQKDIDVLSKRIVKDINRKKKS